MCVCYVKVLQSAYHNKAVFAFIRQGWNRYDNQLVQITETVNRSSKPNSALKACSNNYFTEHIYKQISILNSDMVVLILYCTGCEPSADLTFGLIQAPKRRLDTSSAYVANKVSNNIRKKCCGESFNTFMDNVVILRWMWSAVPHVKVTVHEDLIECVKNNLLDWRSCL